MIFKIFDEILKMDFSSLHGHANIFHYLNTKINIRMLYEHLPIIHISDRAKRLKNKKKDKVGEEGKIFSVRLGDNYRGVEGNMFPNSLTIDLNIKNRSINLKICSDKIQTLGSSIDDALESIKVLFYNFRILDFLLECIIKDNENKKTLNWVLTHTNEQDKLKVPSEYPDKLPENIDKELASYLISFLADYEYSQIKEYQEKIVKIYEDDNKYCEKEVRLKHSAYSMIRYNYSLGGKIDCFKLANLLKKSNSNIKIYYEPSININALYIYLYYKEREDIQKEILRSPNKRHHSILIKADGNLTQVSPHPILAKDAYEQMTTLISNFGNSFFLPV